MVERGADNKKNRKRGKKQKRWEEQRKRIKRKTKSNINSDYVPVPPSSYITINY